MKTVNIEHKYVGRYLINVTSQFRKKLKLSTYFLPKLVKIARVIGLMSLISYMIVILSTWIFANMQGYMYFSAGEHILWIKYLEWILGFIGILTAVDYLYMELNKD